MLTDERITSTLDHPNQSSATAGVRFPAAASLPDPRAAWATAPAPPVGLYEKALPAPWPWEKRLTAAAEAGYAFMEISIDESDERLARLEWPAAAKTELRRCIEASGLPILTMCLSGHRRYSLGSRSPQVRKRGEAIMRRAIEFAVDVGVRIVQVAGYDVFYEDSDAETVEAYLESLRRAAAWAGQAGVMLALENVDAPLTESLAQCMAIVRQVDSPWFQIYPDMANVAAAGYDPVAELAQCAGHLVGVHVKDGLPRTIRRVPFGDGIVPFERVFRLLAGMGYCGPLVVEMWAEPDQSGDPLATPKAARRFVADLVEASYATPSPVRAGWS